MMFLDLVIHIYPTRKRYGGQAMPGSLANLSDLRINQTFKWNGYPAIVVKKEQDRVKIRNYKQHLFWLDAITHRRRTF